MGFLSSPYFTHDASCIMLNIDWTPAPAHAEQYTVRAQTKTNTNPNPDPNRYRRRCPDPNASVMKMAGSYRPEALP